ncbi:unnamed protein product [Heterobilharzia americana]|nr:unnamed protein product [Heterobilharzia americana]
MEEKLGSCMLRIARYCSDLNAVKCKEEDLETLRSSVKKINSLLSSSNQCRKIFIEHEVYVSNLAYILQFLNDRSLRIQIVCVLFKLLGKSGFHSRAMILVQKGITRALFQALYTEYSEVTPSEEFLLKIHQLLCRLGPMDKRFGIRARVNHCIPITIHLLRVQVAILNSSNSTCINTLSTSAGTNPTHATMNGISIIPTSTNLGFLQSNPLQTDVMYNVMSNTHSTSAPTVSSGVRRSLNIILRIIRLYVSNNGKNNSSILGRSGAISLIVRLISLISGLDIFKTLLDVTSSTLSSSYNQCKLTGNLNTTTSTTSVANNNKSNLIGQNSSEVVSFINNHSMRVFNDSMNGDNYQDNNYQLSTPPINSSNNLNSNESPTLGISEVNKNGLIIGSPVIAAVTAIASAAAYVQRFQQQKTEASLSSFQNVKSTSIITNNLDCKINSKYTSDLINSATSLLSATPTLIATGVKHNATLLRLLVNTLHCLIKCRPNTERAITNGAVSLLLDLFLDVHRCDLNWRRIKLQKSLLTCLKCLTTLRSGRKALIASGGIHTLFAVCIGYVGPDPLERNTNLLLRSNSLKKNEKFTSSSSLSHIHRKSDVSRSCRPRAYSITTPTATAVTVTTMTSGTVSTTNVSSVNSKSRSKQLNITGEKMNSTALSTRSSSSPVVTTLVRDDHYLDDNEVMTTMENAENIPLNVANNTFIPTKLSSIVLHKKGPEKAKYTSQSDVMTDRKQYKVCQSRKLSNPVIILIQTCMLLRRCCPRSRLPVASAEGILRCPLPKDNSVTPSSSSRKNSEQLTRKDTLSMLDIEKPDTAKSKWINKLLFYLILVQL